jgi:hypothetical protein
MWRHRNRRIARSDGRRPPSRRGRSWFGYLLAGGVGDRQSLLSSAPPPAADTDPCLFSEGHDHVRCSILPIRGVTKLGKSQSGPTPRVRRVVWSRCTARSELGGMG